MSPLVRRTLTANAALWRRIVNILHISVFILLLNGLVADVPSQSADIQKTPECCNILSLYIVLACMVLCFCSFVLYFLLCVAFVIAFKSFCQGVSQKRGTLMSRDYSLFFLKGLQLKKRRNK